MGLLCAQTGAPLGSGACLAGSADGCVYCGIDPALPAADLSDDELFADLRGVFDAVDPVPPAALPDPAVLARAATRRLDSAVGGSPVPSAADRGELDGKTYCVTCDDAHDGPCTAGRRPTLADRIALHPIAVRLIGAMSRRTPK